MPRIRTLGSRKAPEGWDLLEEKLEELAQKMRDAEREPHEGKRKCESLWPILQLHAERSRFIYEMFYRDKRISRALYDYCLREGYADANLIGRWRKPGYEKLCCLKCIQSADQNFGTTCVCRVPKKSLSTEDGKSIECIHCGCKGCASGDPKVQEE
eukprot:GHVS01085313.1.p1 GENE.GHVS01085313.1~~GHVS01085313.1.p1  ORF type:complete len:156 (+),score=15.47 GHVS01085313.1:79-546(+)